METETEGDVIWHHSISRWTLAPDSSPDTRSVEGTGADTRHVCSTVIFADVSFFYVSV